jgi:hypothetical protein
LVDSGTLSPDRSNELLEIAELVVEPYFCLFFKPRCPCIGRDPLLVSSALSPEWLLIDKNATILEGKCANYSVFTLPKVLNILAVRDVMVLGDVALQSARKDPIMHLCFDIIDPI